MNRCCFISFVTVISIILCLSSCNGTTIKMDEDAGVYYVPCEVEGLPIRMVFDTGASYVSISKEMADLLLSYGCISSSDIVSGVTIIVGDGYHTNCQGVTLKNLKVGNVMLHDVRAIIFDEKKPQLLFGQTAIKKLGKITIDGDKLHIKGSKECELTSQDTDSVFEKWNSRQGTYMSQLYKFEWQLPSSAKWERLYLPSLAYPFGAYSDYSVVMLSVENNAIMSDLWRDFEYWTGRIRRLQKNSYSESRMEGSPEYEKVELCGNHAIKESYTETIELSKDLDTVQYVVNSWHLIHRGVFLTATLKIDKTLFDNYDCSGFIGSVVDGIQLK